jgi:hypothetical protein
VLKLASNGRDPLCVVRSRHSRCVRNQGVSDPIIELRALTHVKSRAGIAQCRAAGSLSNALRAKLEPAAVNRYMWRGGRPCSAAGCHFDSRFPRSHNRMSIGYSVPDFSFVICDNS